LPKTLNAREGISVYQNLAFKVADIRQAENQLISELPERALMERAAFGLASFISKLIRESDLTPQQTLIVAIVGKGNNGEDALVAGEYLKQKGFQFIALDYKADSSANQKIVSQAQVVLDAIVGLGSNSPISQSAKNLFSNVSSNAVTIAVDLPSGINPDSGEVFDKNFVVKADYTVTLGTLKAGLVTGAAKQYVGELHLVDIGLAAYLTSFTPLAVIATQEQLNLLYPRRAKSSHKYSKGVVEINAGSKKYPGAASLCLAGAVASGVGMITYSGEAAASLIKKLPQVIFSSVNKSKVTASVLGPGQSEIAKNYLSTIKQSKKLILDATSISLLANKAVVNLIKKQGTEVLITPHEKEAKDLCQKLKIPFTTNRIELAKALAKKTGAICLLKGPGAILARSDFDTVLIDQFGTEALATAGSGDVLAGLIGGLAANSDTSLMQAGILGLAIMGEAGRLANSFAPEPALDLVVQTIPVAISEMVS
jgi:ADP-dependent NAD(P)H-hydrate dehydratase / NAD(P)H-hydrate epimerase